MIKINTSNLGDAIDNHLEAVEIWAMPLVDFHICIIEKLLGNSSLPKDTFKKKGERLSTYFKCDGNSLNSNANIYITQKKIKKKINNPSLEGFLTGHNTLISKQKRKPILRECMVVLKFLKSHFKEIVTGNPKLIIGFHDTHYEKLNLPSKELLKKILESILNYEKLTGSKPFKLANGNVWDNYSLTEKIGLKVCPYCNRNWIGTVKDKNDDKIVNPQLDHFFDKAEHPLLRLSFYNLIPSCENCNSRLKGSEKFNLKDYIHPYLGGYESHAKFKVTPMDYESSLGLKENYKVELRIDKSSPIYNQINKSNELFHINDIYQFHGDIISEIYEKKHLTDENYLSVLQKTFYKDIDSDKLYRIALGNYKRHEDFHKRPFAKLTRDVSGQLGLI